MAEVITLGSKKAPEITTKAHITASNGAGYLGTAYPSDLPNFLCRPLTLLDKILWLPLASGMAWLKKLLKWGFVVLVLTLAAIGAVASYFAYQYQGGHLSFYVLSGEEYKYFGKPENLLIEQAVPEKKSKK